MPLIPVGLCGNCRHQRLVKTGRGSEFSMCLRHREDRSFLKYPRIPVLECRGHELRDRAEPSET